MSASTSLNRTQSARDISYGVVQYITATVTFATLGIGTADTVLVGTLPAGSQVIDTIVRITAVFNAATTNVLTIGTSSGSNADFVNAGAVNEGATGTTVVLTANDLNFTADTPIYVKYTQTGTAATTGRAIITITYVATLNG